MAAYEYQALTEKGKKKKGILEGDTPRRVRQLLREQGLAPVSVELVNKATPQRGEKTNSNRISIKNLSLLTRQLAVLVRSGQPLEEALQVVAEQTESSRVRRLIAGIRAKVLEGRSLSQAIDLFPNAFPPLYRATVEAGESSGQLDGILERLAIYLENREQTRQKLQLALIYPILLTGISFLVVIGLLTFVVPEIVGVFNDLDQQLPTLTQGLITLSELLKSYGLHLLVGVILFWVLIKQTLKVKRLQIKLHRFILRLPLFGRFARGANTASFTRTLAILTGSGVELLEALRIAGQVTPNLAISSAIQSAAIRVREGGTLSKALAQSRLFPPITVHLIASGESSGQLAEMLENAAANQEREVQSFTEMTLGIFEPVLILLMGGVVLTIVLAILLPIFEINQLVN
ncbi:type II secretion system inner membrane protein GspF [Sedimenticola sp.]|uniref:type II secretion system inner membrane protein GspF n=1 Tax=Sedimenticola sp. TaxID=1940285 RepID=UPI003D0CEE2F